MLKTLLILECIAHTLNESTARLRDMGNSGAIVYSQPVSRNNARHAIND